MLKCLICKKIIFPKLVCTPGEEDTLTICEDHEEWTEQQRIEFEVAFNKALQDRMDKNFYKWITIEAPKKYVPRPLVEDESRGLVDI